MMKVMKLKKYIYKIGVLGIIGLMMTSCSDFLEVEPLNTITLGKFWKEKSDVDNAVTGCYASMESSAIISRMMCWGEFRSDNIIGGTNAENNVDLTNILKENINASNGFTTWGDFYYVINSCNTVLYYAPQVAAADPSFNESDLNTAIAEVSALRDLCYFYLIRTFRDVPYSTEPFLDDNQTMDLPATPFNTVLDSIINDLESVKDYALRRYPSTKTNYNTARITRTGIYAMLADMYLWKEDYENSIKYANLVINNKLEDYENEHQGVISQSDRLIEGFPLISDQGTSNYGNAFTEIFVKGHSTESIFELDFADNDSRLANSAVSTYYGNATTSPGLVKAAEFIATDPTLDNPTVFNTKYDTRGYENVGASSLINKYVSASDMIVTKDGTTSFKANTRTLYPEAYNHGNWIIYRLTDVMLMKAEALTQLVNDEDSTDYGKTRNDSLLNEALTLVNAVSERSCGQNTYTALKLTDYHTKTLMTDLVMDERERELMFEGKRWYDLVRRSRREGNTRYLVQEINRKGSDNSAKNASFFAKLDAMYWPYNLDEIRVNKNLVQNTAFGSGENSSYERN